MATDRWDLEHKSVAAVRIDGQARITGATPDAGALFGGSAESLIGVALAYFCSEHLDGATGPRGLLQLGDGDTALIAGMRVQAESSEGETRTLVFERVHDAGPPEAPAEEVADAEAGTPVEEERTEEGHTEERAESLADIGPPPGQPERRQGERRRTHDRLLHVLVSDLLDGSVRDPDRVIDDVLTGLADYFDFVTVALTVTEGSTPIVINYASNVGCTRDTFDRLSTELRLTEAPDIDRLLEPAGPGDVWRIDLDSEDSYSIGVDHDSLICFQVTVPYDEEEEVSLLATLGGDRTPARIDLELAHKALSHLAQYLRRTTAEELIRRRAELDEALGDARTGLLEADPSDLLQALTGPAQRVAAITRSTSLDIRPIALVGAQLTRALLQWNSPRPVSPDSLGYAPDVKGTWAVPINDAQGPIAMLSYIVDDPRTAADTAAAWQRLAELIPGTSARIEVERRLEATFHGGPVAIAVRNTAGKLVDCNDAFVRFIGAPDAATLLGTSRLELVDLDACEPAHRDQITDDAVFDGIELPFNRPDDEPVWGRVTTTVADDASGSVLIDHVEDVTLTRVTQAELATARRRDALTGLPNRKEIEAQLARRIANDEPITVTAIDLDHFSTMNASLGHIAGDRLLQLVAERLQLTVGSRAELARTGGDEFIVVSPTSSQQLARDLADRILASLRLPFDIDGNELLTGASVGVCIARGATSPSEILLAATEALNEAKTSGRNRVVYHQSKSSKRRAGLFESELRRAVHERVLEVYYQPEFDVETRLIVGAEALVRWNHPAEGLLAAGAFVPLIEELGLSSELCDHVLHNACEAADEWRSALAPNPFKIRINLSPRDIEQADIVERVMRAIDDTGLPVSSLCLEVTETAVMRDQRRVVRHLRALSDMGISLAIDDFGTGFSSLWLLRELPFDTLKIDKAFIAALDSGLDQDRLIVETIVNLGQTLGMEVTAEGVETTSQFDMLREIGIRRAQGFLLARPEPKAMLVDSLARAGQN